MNLVLDMIFGNNQYEQTPEGWEELKTQVNKNFVVLVDNGLLNLPQHGVTPSIVKKRVDERLQTIRQSMMEHYAKQKVEETFPIEIMTQTLNRYYIHATIYYYETWNTPFMGGPVVSPVTNFLLTHDYPQNEWGTHIPFEKVKHDVLTWNNYKQAAYAKHTIKKDLETILDGRARVDLKILQVPEQKEGEKTNEPNPR